MLDGKHYYEVFPDEHPKMRIQRILGALEKLEKEFRRIIEQCSAETIQPGEDKTPDA